MSNKAAKPMPGCELFMDGRVYEYFERMTDGAINEWKLFYVLLLSFAIYLLNCNLRTQFLS